MGNTQIGVNKDAHLYRDYLTSALRHLATCNNILTLLNSMNEDDDDYQPLLFDAYYLSGYVVEGICVFCLYKWFKFDKKRFIERGDKSFTNKTGVQFYKDKDKLSVQSHDFKSYIKPLINDEDFQVNNPDFPYLVKQSINEKENEVIDLINKWNTSIRYKTNKNYQVKIDIDKIKLRRLLKMLEEMIDMSRSLNVI